MTKRESTLREWQRVLEKAEERLANSKRCYVKFGDKGSLEWVKEDQAKVDEIKKNIEKVIAYMDKHNIK